MPQQQQQRRRPQAPPQRPAPAQDKPTMALVAVTREIDNRLAIIEAGSIAGVRPDRLKLVALTMFSRTPALWTCTPVSVARAIVEAGQLGLEPTGLLGGAYLIPRGDQATLLVGYRGLVVLAKRSGEVQRVEARIVREKDEFEYGYGLEPWLRHVPSRDPDPGPYTGAYAILFYRDGSKQFDYMSRAEIEAIRKRSSSPDKGPWVTDEAEMWKKTPLRRLMKLAPLALEVAAKLDELDPEVDDAAPQATRSRQAELREQLQHELAREYGQEVEGESRELPPAGQPQSQGGAGTPAQANAPAAAPAASGAQARQAAAPAADSAPAAGAPAAPRPAGKPEQVGAIMGNPSECGARNEQLDAGPCVLPPRHDQGPWHDPAGNEYPPQREHQEAGGTRFSLPQRGGAQ